jgi:hypothetical protein
LCCIAQETIGPRNKRAKGAIGNPRFQALALRSYILGLFA